MKRCIVFFATIIVCVAVHAQTDTEQTENLSFKSATWGYKYCVGDRQVSYDEFMSKLNGRDLIAGKMFKSGKNLGIAGTVVGGIGAFCFGYDIGTRLAGGNGNTALLVGGGGVMAGGIIMFYVGEGKMKKALTLYKNNSTSLHVSPTQTGVGLCLNF